jgi:hypothetical protein
MPFSGNALDSRVNIDSTETAPTSVSMALDDENGGKVEEANRG